MNFVQSRLVSLPIHLQCTHCNSEYPKGSESQMYYEQLGGMSTLIGVKVHRFYWKCAACLEWMVFRSEFGHLGYLCEYGCQRSKDPKERLKPSNRKGVVKPSKLLEVFSDRATVEISDAFENSLKRLRARDRIEKTTQRWLLRLIIKEEFGNCKDRLDEPVYEDRGELQLCPFIRKLMRKRIGDLEPFLDTVHQFLSTKMLRTIIPPGEMALEYSVKCYEEHMEKLKICKPLEAGDKVDGGPCDFYSAILEDPGERLTPFDVIYNEPMHVPMRIECNACHNVHPEGAVVPMNHETIGFDRQLIRLKLYRFHMRCAVCSSQLVFRTSLSQEFFVVERGIFEKEEDDDDPDDLEADRAAKERMDENPFNREKYFNPNFLLGSFDWEFNAVEVIRDFEDHLYILNMVRESGRSVDAIFEKRLRKEDRWRAAQPTPPPVDLEWNIPFSETLQAIPKNYIWRFLRAVYKQLVPMELADGDLPTDRSVVKPSRPNAFPTELTLVPVSISCRVCRQAMHKDSRLVMSREVIFGTPEVAFQVHRLYTQCPFCTNDITFRSEIYKQAWRIEIGGVPMFDRTKHVARDARPAFDPWTLVSGIRDEAAPVWAGKLEDFYEFLMKHPEDSQYWTMVQSPLQKVEEWDVADVYTTTRRLMTAEFKRVMSEPPPVKNENLRRIEAQKDMFDELRDRFLVTSRRTDQYSNFFKFDRKRETNLRRPELAERRKPILSNLPRELSSSIICVD